ncbi:MAG: hypothetical protein WAK82_41855 [Streptosporangiaceae bacterium]
MTDHLPADLEDRVRDAYQAAAQTVQPQTLRRTWPLLAPGAVPPWSRMNVFAPIAAAIAVIVAIGLSVALPRLLADDSSSPNPPAGGTSAAAAGQYPPFQVLRTANDGNGETTLMMVSAATGHVMSRLAPPPFHDAQWTSVAATADPTRFIVAAGTTANEWFAPTRLYTLILSARGAVVRLAPLAVPSLPGSLTSMAASADGRTVAYTMQAIGGANEVGVITGGRRRQWSASGPEIQAAGSVSVSSDGDMIAFTGNGSPKDDSEITAWVLPTASAPGNIAFRARKVYDRVYVGEPPGSGETAVISPDARTLYVSTNTSSAGGKAVNTVTAYSTASQAAPRTITAWDNIAPVTLTLIGGTPVILASSAVWFNPKGDPTVYLINPATLTTTTLRLRGIPPGGYLQLAW